MYWCILFYDPSRPKGRHSLNSHLHGHFHVINITSCHKLWSKHTKSLGVNAIKQNRTRYWKVYKFQQHCHYPVKIPDSFYNRRSLDIQGTALGKSLRALTCTYRSMPAGVAQSRHAFVGGTVSTWARWRIPVNKRQKRHQKCWSNTHCSQGKCRTDSRFPQLVD